MNITYNHFMARSTCVSHQPYC